MDHCLLCLSTTMAVVYTVLHFTKNGETVCAANQSDFWPLDYPNNEFLQEYLNRHGSINVTKRFNFVINMGLCSNLLICIYIILKVCVAKQKQLDRLVATRTLVVFLINILWVVQFFLLVVFRFSHTGKVCSGDYKKYILDKDAEIPEDSKQYARNE